MLSHLNFQTITINFSDHIGDLTTSGDYDWILSNDNLIIFMIIGRSLAAKIASLLQYPMIGLELEV